MNTQHPHPAAASSERWRSRGRTLTGYFRADWLRYTTLFVVGFLVRARGLTGQRIWDDQYLSLENPFIKSPLLILESFRHYLFLESFSSHYRPVQNISYLFDYFFWNTDPYGFHLTNVLLHAGSEYCSISYFENFCHPSGCATLRWRSATAFKKGFR